MTTEQEGHPPLRQAPIFGEGPMVGARERGHTSSETTRRDDRTESRRITHPQEFMPSAALAVSGASCAIGVEPVMRF